MAIQIDPQLKIPDLKKQLTRFFELAGKKIHSIEKSADSTSGAPVFTVQGRYTTRGWTEWTQGFQYGSSLLQFEATEEAEFLELGRQKTVSAMAPHISHIGVHDHGFNNVSTYGNLLRMMNEGRIPENTWERNFYELALKISGAVQASRWTSTADGGGFVHSFNGPHSLFVDTIRSVRALMVSHALGHVLMGEQDEKINLLVRGALHSISTANHSVYYGEGRDSYDLRGRSAHEIIFNTKNGVARCPSTQQGYSAFSTWTRGLAWAMCGFAEELEFLRDWGTDEDWAVAGGRKQLQDIYLKAATATCDFYLENVCACGIPMWDTGAPQLWRLQDDYLNQPANPFNPWEPVDSSAAAIAAQGLLRLGDYLSTQGETGTQYSQAGLKVAQTLFDEPYLSTHEDHQGLILHSVYHRPNGWDHCPDNDGVPRGESSMWGDYHAMELGVYLWRQANGQKGQRFYDCVSGVSGMNEK